MKIDVSSYPFVFPFFSSLLSSLLSLLSLLSASYTQIPSKV